MFPDPRLEGAYVPLYPPWVDFLGHHLDYFWFFSGLVWSLVLVLYWRHPQRSALQAWQWLPWTAGTGFLSAAIVLLSLVTPTLVTSSVNKNAAGLVGDLALGAITLAGIGAWSWLAAAGRPVARRLCWGLFVLLAGIAVWRYWPRDLLLVSWLLAGAALLGAVPWWFRPGAGFWSRAALVAAALMPLFSTIGPLPLWFSSQGYQRWSIANPAGLRAGVFQLLAGGVALAGLVAHLRAGASREARRDFRHEARPYALTGLTCLVAGLLAALLNGQHQNASAATALLRRGEFLAESVDLRAVERAVDTVFQVTPPFIMRPWGPVQQVPALEDRAWDPLRHSLGAMAKAARELVRSVAIVTLRDGRLVVLFTNLSRTPGEVQVARPASDEDHLNWDRRSAWTEGPVSLAQGTGAVHFARVPLLGSDGRMLGWLEVTGWGENRSAGPRVVIFACTNLTLVLIAMLFVQRQQARREESARRDIALAAAANRIKTDFLAKVSHELRTPLQSLLGYGELLEREVTSESGRTHLNALRQHGDLMIRLVNDLLDLSAIEAGSFRLQEGPVALPALVRDATESLRPRAVAKGLALTCTVAGEVPAWVKGDGTRLSQIVLNLVGNAVKFTDHGRIDVTLDAEPQSARQCLIHLRVRDTGPGIPPEDQARLFQPFARLAGADHLEGTGLGLALVAALARSHGGQALIDAPEDTGACFHVTLPLPLASPHPESAAQNPRLLRDRRVLIAEDNRLVRELFLVCLREHGAVCEAVAEGREAISRVKTGDWDILLLDVGLPGVDGLEVARRLRADPGVRRSLRIVGVSAHASAAQQASLAGMDVFLPKPVKLADLLQAVTAHSAPAPAGLPPQLKVRLAALFRAELETQATRLSQAIADRNWTQVIVLAHYLKSSAGVVEDAALYDACGRLESAAEKGAMGLVNHAWHECSLVLARWAAIQTPGASPKD